MKKLISAMILLSAFGCAHNQTTYFVKPPAPPPTVPSAKTVAIDSTLRDTAKAKLSEAARSTDAVLRANAMEAIQDTVGIELKETILAGLKDEDPLVRFAAAMSAGKLQLTEARPIVLSLLNDADPNVKIGAIFALHQLGDTSHSHELELLARHTDPYVRANVALALGLLGDVSALHPLRNMTADPNVNVRLQVAEAMWRLGDEDAFQLLLAATFLQSDTYLGAQQSVAVLALGQRHDNRVKYAFYGKLTSDYPEVSLTAARSMGMIGSDAGYGVALKYVQSKDWRQRLLAALAFGQIGRPDAQDHLRPLLNDPEPSVQIAAATAILQLKANN